jgi:hypothetical protein
VNQQVEISEIIDELQRQFPKELTIAVQAVQIRKMQEVLNDDEPEVSQDDE